MIHASSRANGICSAIFFCRLDSRYQPGLRSTTGSLNYLGFLKSPSKFGISYISKHRTHELFKDLYFQLVYSGGKMTHLRKELCGLKEKRNFGYI